jgi:hypothetical protein
MEAAKKSERKQPVCACGNTSKRVVFLTFEYDYCQTCKKEVGGKGEPEKKINPWDAWSDERLDLRAGTVPAGGGAGGASSFGGVLSSSSSPYAPGAAGAAGRIQQPGPAFHGAPSNLPPGYVALKNDQVTCDTCGHLKFFLDDDLQFIPTGRAGRLWSTKMLNNVLRYSPTVGCGNCKNCPGRFAQSYPGTLHIKGRGWV